MAALSSSKTANIDDLSVVSKPIIHSTTQTHVVKDLTDNTKNNELSLDKGFLHNLYNFLNKDELEKQRLDHLAFQAKMDRQAREDREYQKKLDDETKPKEMAPVPNETNSPTPKTSTSDKKVESHGEKPQHTDKPHQKVEQSQPTNQASSVSVNGYKIHYNMEDGSSHIKTGGSKSWRNNNEGNIRYGDYAESKGAIGEDPDGFAIFKTPEDGLKAKSDLIFNSPSYKNLKLSEAIPRYAPKEDGNNTKAYTDTVLSAVGHKDKKMSDFNPAEQEKILIAMKHVEGYNPGHVKLVDMEPKHNSYKHSEAISKNDLIKVNQNVDEQLAFLSSKEMVKKHEGLKLEPYKDSRGFWTIGRGHLITTNPELPKEWKHKKITENEADKLFDKDFLKAYDGAKKHPAWDLVDSNGKAALVDLSYNMGSNWQDKWKDTTKMMVHGQMDGVSKSILHSKYATQVGHRAENNAKLLKDSYIGTSEKSIKKEYSQDEMKDKIKDFIHNNKGNPKVLSQLTEQMDNQELKKYAMLEIGNISQSKSSSHHSKSRSDTRDV